MVKFKKPNVYLVGKTQMIDEGVFSFLWDNHYKDFDKELAKAEKDEIAPELSLASLFAKLCYESLDSEHNLNISKTRSIKENLLATMNHAHWSVFRHIWMSFIFSDVSRVFTHELVRHGIGTAVSQTSGRYVRNSSIDFVNQFQEILPNMGGGSDIDESSIEHLTKVVEASEEAYNFYQDLFGLNGLSACRQAMYSLNQRNIDNSMVQKINETANKYVELCSDFSHRKMLTSLIRRILPEGRANKIAFSANLNSLLHIIQMRTSRHAEREIRYVFEQVFELINEQYPILFSNAKIKMVDGIAEISGIKLQPYAE